MGLQSQCVPCWMTKECLILRNMPHAYEGQEVEYFPHFNYSKSGMTFISIITAILYKIVISSSQQDSFSLQIKAIAGE